jgi:general secretion pathway protein D
MTLINQLDSQTKQVLIEAHIYETAKNPSTIKGIDWSGTFENQQFTFGNNALPPLAGTPATPPVIAPGGAVIPGTPATAPTINSILNTPRLLASTASGFSPGTAFLNADGVQAVLSFLNKDTDTEVVATPRAVTLDNQMAQLSVTRAFPIFQITPGSANSPAGASIQYTNLGTILQVTPRIAADQNISLKVVPEVSNIDGKDQQTINGALNIANIYAIRRIETYVMIPSGHTLVMGGLINDSSTKAFTKVPILGDAPFIGAAFRHSRKARQKQNLIVFLTPTIIEDGDFHLSSSGSEFLQNEVVEKPDVQETPWDSAKPHDWTKPVN